MEACRVIVDDVAFEAVLRDSSILKGFPQQSGVRMGYCGTVESGRPEVEYEAESAVESVDLKELRV